MSNIRRAVVAQALESFQGLTSTLGEMTENEVIAALEVESSALRRQTVIDRLISRAVRLRELSYAASLKEKFCGKSKVDDPR